MPDRNYKETLEKFAALAGIEGSFCLPPVAKEEEDSSLWGFWPFHRTTRKEESSLTPNERIKVVIWHMLQFDPANRITAAEALAEIRTVLGVLKEEAARKEAEARVNLERLKMEAEREAVDGVAEV